MKSISQIIIGIILVMVFAMNSVFAQTSLPQVSYVSNPQTPSTRTLDANKVVGASKWSADVSKDGKAVYSIPIYVAPGTKSMAPQLAISYSSTVNNGLLGIGWNLSGLSQISRSGSNVFSHGEGRAVQKDWDDNLILDGNELILTNPPSGHIFSYTFNYITKNNDYSKIERVYNATIPSVDYFKVYSKTGIIKEYGRNTGSTNGIVWKLNKVIDQNGNYIKYNYSIINEQIVLGSIDYTGNDVASPILVPYNKVIFNYKSRTDAVDKYVAGDIIRNFNILESIHIQCEGVIFKKYNLKYIYDEFLGATKLYSVEEQDANSNSYNETLIEWGGERSNSNSFSPYTDIASADPKCFGDFNGDGIQDIVIITSTSSITSFISDGNGGYTEYSSVLSDENNGSIIVGGIYAGDYDNDGMDELFVRKAGKIFLFHFLNGSFTCDKTINQTQVTSIEMLNVMMVDLTGNGLNEMVIYDDMYIYQIRRGSLTSLSTNIALPNIASTGTCFKVDYALRVADFNGNGKMELLLLDDNYAAYEYDEVSYSFLPIIMNVPIEVSMNNDYNASIVDINADGYSDIFYTSKDDAYVNKCFLYDGNNFIQISVNFVGFPNVAPQPIDPPYPGYGHQAEYYMLNDFNTDGYVDLLINGQHLYNRGVNNGSIIFEYVGAGSTNPYINDCNMGDMYVDFDGDGYLDKLTSSNNFVYRNNNEAKFVKAIYDGVNNYVKFNYETLSTDNEYEKATGLSYPEIGFTGPIHIVKDLIKPDGIGGELVNHYIYKGGKINKQGIGFVGFDELNIKQYDGFTSKMFFASEIVTNNGHNHFVKYLSKEEVYLTATNFLINKTENVYNKTFFIGGKQMSIRKVSKVSTNSLKNTKETYNYTINYTTGNTSIVLKKYYDGGTLTKTINISNNYGSISGWHVPSLLTTMTLSKTRSGKPNTSSAYSYSYDSKGNLAMKVTNPSLVDFSTIESYDNINDFGLNTKTTISEFYSNSNLTPRIIYNIFDSKSRFTLSTTNGIGSISKTYDPKFGGILSVTDINGNVSTNTYDGFGYLLTNSNILGEVTTKSKFWVNNIANSPTAIFGKSTSKNYGGNIIEYYDKLARKVAVCEKVGKAVSSGYDNLYAFVNFNSLGQVYRQSKQGISLNQSLIQWSVNTYDSYGRISTNKIHKQSPTTYIYNDNSITVSNPTANKNTTKTFDVTGMVVKVEDNGGIITYDYDSDNNLISTTTNGLNSAFTYDVNGNILTNYNPNNGLYTYTYNKFGEKTSAETPKGDLTNYTYNAYGQLTAEVRNSVVQKAYTYRGSSPAKGQLNNIILNNSCNIDYNYNAYGQVISYTEAIEGKPFTFKFTYIGSKIASKKYPSDYEVGYSYDSYSGILKSVYDITNNKPISSIQAYYHTIGKGVPHQILLGENIVNKICYVSGVNASNFRSLSNMSYSDVSTNSVIHSMSYNFDGDSRNLLSRTDDIRALTETFAYDNNDRLISYDNEVTGRLTTTYVSNGNISKSEGVGNYTYDNVRKNAVRTIDFNKEIINEAQETSYTYFNKISVISQGRKNATFAYGYDNERRAMSYIDADGTKSTTYYLGDYEYTEKEGEITANHYINGVGGLSALYVLKKDADADRGSMFYVAKDYLGSITALIDGENKIVNQNSFDAWGRSRNPNNWKYDMRYKEEMPLPELTTRGYTGHEHLNAFQLINMNGRLYDPITKQMSQPDILNTNHYSTQSYNRYSYVMNNPLKYTDPSGYSWFGWSFGWAEITDEEQGSYLLNDIHGLCAEFEAINPSGTIGSLSMLGESVQGGGWAFGTMPDTRSEGEKSADKQKENKEGEDDIPHGGIMYYTESGEPLRVTGRGDVNTIYIVNDEDVASFLVEYVSELLFSNGDFSGLADKYGSSSYDVNVNADGTSVSGVVNAPWYMYAAMGASVMGEGFAAGRASGRSFQTYGQNGLSGLGGHYNQQLNYGLTNSWNNYLNVPRQFQPWW